MNIKICGGLSQDSGWVAKICLCFLGGHSSWEEKHTSKMPRKSRDTPVKSCFVFSLRCFLCSQNSKRKCLTGTGQTLRCTRAIPFKNLLLGIHGAQNLSRTTENTSHRAIPVIVSSGSDLKTRASNRWRTCNLKLRFETRDWRFVLNTPIEQNCEKGRDLSPRSKIASDWRLAILPI